MAAKLEYEIFSQKTLISYHIHMRIFPQMTVPWRILIDMQEMRGLAGVFGSCMAPQNIPSLLHKMENERKQLSINI